MDIRFLDARTTRGSIDQHLCHLIAAIGTPGFERAMLALAKQTIQCAHLTAFSVSKLRPPRVLLAVNDGDLPIARRLASKYIQDYWSLDPANSVVANEPRTGFGAMIRLQSDEIEDASYRRDCYRSVHLIDRLSIVRSHGRDTIRLNFYRDGPRGRFTDGDLDVVADLANLLAQVLEKHNDIRPPLSKEDRFEQYCNRLGAIAPQLSNREIQICAEIVRGLSSQAIASKLGVSINTVLTHRKRAYARLGISSQNELSHMLLH